MGAIPFFVWMLNEELDSICTLKAAEVAKIIVAATKNTEIATKNSTLKTFFTTAKGKVIATGVMVAVLAGGVGIYSVFSQQPKAESKIEHKTIKKKTTKKEESKVEETREEVTHTHNWVAQYKTVHHDAIKQTQTVVDQEAYDEPVYSTRTVTKVQFGTYTGKYFDSSQEAMEYMKSLGYDTVKGSTGPVQVQEQYQSGTIHHDAVTHQEEVVVQDAYDEQILTGYKCSECGEMQ